MRGALVLLVLLMVSLPQVSALFPAPVGFCAVPPDDAGARRDASHDDPVDVQQRTAWSGCVTMVDFEDSFEVTAAYGTDILFQADAGDCEPLSLVIHKYYPHDREGTMREVARFTPDECRTPLVHHRVGASGVRFLLEVGHQGGRGPYTATLAMGKPLVGGCGAEQDDGESGGDAGETAPLVEIGVVRGCVDAIDEADRFRLPVGAGERVQIAALPPEHCRDVHISLSMGATGGADGARACRPLYAGLATPAPGDLTLRVWTSRETWAYDLDVRIVTGEPSACDPADDGASGRDSAEEARVALALGEHMGCLDRFDHDDGYTLDVVAGRSYVADLQHGEAPLCSYGLWLYHEDGDVEYPDGGCNSTGQTTYWYASVTETMLIDVPRGSHLEGEYTIRLAECRVAGLVPPPLFSGDFGLTC